MINNNRYNKIVLKTYCRKTGIHEADDTIKTDNKVYKKY